ncbi:hypothetical protein HHL24_17035 [Paraburkholderia sp. RP-4-7]|uniref:Uncharacterized protein n=1 Tax=Paraburkholderia polaris TaxID=2728848 RepID=A0A848IIX5_9BURK|nr:hypothetical protein [Paraburkholderia polaris]NML99633.1 hypothetical protein [Paraburkholderia polaris]
MHKQLSATEMAKRAAAELAGAQRAIEQANALFGVIQMLVNCGDPAQIFLMAQIGGEMTGYSAERAESESEYFAGAGHD